MSSTPSPTASATTGTASRRPPRKSTLTQQQKNQKRQRATQDQLITLEVEFNKNPTPTAIVRERIAQDISMTERSVQIWFQNRRAKIKLLAKKSIETGEDCDSIPDSMRKYLAIQAMESGQPLGRAFFGRSGEPMIPHGNGNMLPGAEPNGSSKVVIQYFSCRSLSIGSWRRVGQNAMDLVIFFSPDKACLTYYINNDSAGYKIEYPFAHVKNISLEQGDPMPNLTGTPQRLGGLVVELSRPPNFFMDSSGSGGFYQCGDFTEDQQASQIMIHHLGGPPKVLSGQLAKFLSLDSYQNRHRAFESNVLSASAPVSPIQQRPASQPNHLIHPHVGMFQESQFGARLHPGATRGHKRTRSRSVPAAIDFSMLQHPMPSFHIQHEPSNQLEDSNIYAPIPQHSNSLGPPGSNLRIDTTSGYGMDFRHYPISAATTTSPSEYASPSFFSNAGHSDNGLPMANYNNPYSLPYLSPLVDHPSMAGPSVSPLSMGHGDPVIADQSPPMSAMHRSNSVDLFPLPHEQSNMSDDGLTLSDLYSKQSLNLPMHSPGIEGPSEEIDMHNMVSFGTIDPSSLSPENSGLDSLN
ncbi:MAG: Transcription elongation factor SPT4 [Candelina mexicana]|nr:MAG: Transcription elongation factor SPT4 [Candelina mexicana]